MKSYCLSVSILALALAAGPALAQQSPSDALPPNVRFTQPFTQPYPGMPLQNQPFQQNYQNQGPQNQQTVPGGNGGMSLDSTWPIQGPALPVDPTAPISASPPSFGSPAVVPEQAVAPRRPPMEDRDAMARAWSDDASQAARQAGMNLGHGPSRGLAHSTKYSDVQHLARWKKHLLDLGVPEQKIVFESRRLSRADFDLWASRLLWWERGLHPNQIDVHLTPAEVLLINE